MTTALQTLSEKLCPWLDPAFQQVSTAHRAGHLGHAWLISGPAGTGKLNLALALAHRMLGGEGGSADLDADAALSALAARHTPMDRHPDLHWLHPEEDKETISVEQVREVIEALTLTAHRGGAKIVIVETAEAMTTPAANALLKTLEEPSRGSYLFLLTHQPGRLAATIRSRCQHLPLRPPAEAIVANWLGVAPTVIADAGRLIGAAPLRIAAAVRSNDINFFNGLESDLAALCQDRLDPQTVAQSWAKDQTERVLTWLKRRLHEELRSRSTATGGSTEVTVQTSATLHNAWRTVPARTLFDQYDRAEKLLNQLGSGLNVELALQAMLSAFLVNRGRS
jgi:DNA polymerase III subunit delta'